ncbi:hypothetical protein [Paraburkholderia sp. J11-2]|uniref:hypothetical protein n=1 Tax=Paraburkholderia sp. J11-2 TaxID=2805431 RepID=UPI002AB78075|nr:hypothetical protein [Paraburkholderia sp. J11-2]
MKREIRKLFERVARANGLNTRGRRAYKRRFYRDYQQTLVQAQQAIEPFAGREYNKQTMLDLMASLGAVGPDAPPPYLISFDENRVERTMSFQITFRSGGEPVELRDAVVDAQPMATEG